MRKIFKSIMLMALLSATPLTVSAVVFNINVNTTSLAGTTVNLAFDFINGDGLTNNTAQVSNFLTDGNFDPNLGSLTGGVSGLLNSTVIFSDTSFFNEFLQPVTLGNAFQFQLYTTNALTGLLPDSFSFFILGSNGLPLVTTTDPAGSDNS
jgi:hypothetical protein